MSVSKSTVVGEAVDLPVVILRVLLYKILRFHDCRIIVFSVESRSHGLQGRLARHSLKGVKVEEKRGGSSNWVCSRSGAVADSRLAWIRHRLSVGVNHPMI